MLGKPYPKPSDEPRRRLRESLVNAAAALNDPRLTPLDLAPNLRWYLHGFIQLTLKWALPKGSPGRPGGTNPARSLAESMFLEVLHNHGIRHETGSPSDVADALALFVNKVFIQHGRTIKCGDSARRVFGKVVERERRAQERWRSPEAQEWRRRLEDDLKREGWIDAEVRLWPDAAEGPEHTR